MTSPPHRPLSRRWNRTLSQARRDETERPGCWIRDQLRGSAGYGVWRPGWAGPAWAGPEWEGPGPGYSSLDLLTLPTFKIATFLNKKVKGRGNKYFIFTLVLKPVDSFSTRSSEHLHLRFTGPPHWLLRPRHHRLIGPERLTSSGRERGARCTSTVRERERRRERRSQTSGSVQQRSKTAEIKDSPQKKKLESQKQSGGFSFDPRGNTKERMSGRRKV